MGLPLSSTSGFRHPAIAGCNGNFLLGVIHFYLGQTAVLRGTGIGIALFLGNGLLGIGLFGRGVLVGINGLLAGIVARVGRFFIGRGIGFCRLHLRLGIGLGGGLGGLRLLHAYVLGIAGQVVALFLGHAIVGLSLGDAGLVAGFLGRLVAGFEIGQCNLFLALGLGDADIAGVAGQRVAGGLGRLVVGGNLVLVALVIAFGHTFSHGTGAECKGDRQGDRIDVEFFHCRSLSVDPWTVALANDARTTVFFAKAAQCLSIAYRRSPGMHCFWLRWGEATGQLRRHLSPGAHRTPD